jgi:hypothetical protein
MGLVTTTTWQIRIGAGHCSFFYFSQSVVLHLSFIVDSTSRNNNNAMSSRRDKQAELRRRMAEARSKLSLLANNESSDRDLIVEAAMAKSAASATSSSERGETRPHLSAPRGGILRKPKYSNTSSSITDDDVPAAALQSMTSTTKESNDADHHTVGVSATKSTRLGDLMADYYGDSSSDDDDHEKMEDGGENDAALSSSSSAENGYASRETQINPPSSRSKSITMTTSTNPHAMKATVTVDEDTSSRRKKHPILLDAPESELSVKIFDVDATPSIQAEAGKSSEISDEVWDEFNALLEEDDTNAFNNATTNSDHTISSNAEGATTVFAHVVDAPPTTTTSTKTVQKKKKKRDSTPTTIKKDMYDNDATINFEQASYEARLARLMLLKSKKARHKTNNNAAANSSGNDGVVDALLIKSAKHEFYDPGLAFQEEGGEVDEDAQYVNDGRGVSGGRLMVENPTSSKSGTYDMMMGSSSETSFSMITPAAVASPPSQTVLTSLSAPRTMATILRDRREEARKLSSRGGGAGRDDDGGMRGSESALLDDEYGVDGQWF